MNDTPHKVRRLFWDVEVSPNLALIWRPGFKISVNPEAIVQERQTICIGYKWEGERSSHILRWDRNHDDKSMLKSFLAIADDADEMVAHFGDKYDMPWLQARCVIQGLDPTPIYKTVDTCAIANRYYLFNSNKLDYLGEVLGFGNKLHTTFALWKDITLHGCQKSLNKMCLYCMRDVVLLEKVWTKLRYSTKAKSHTGVMAGLPRWTCPESGSTNVRRKKVMITPMGIVQHQMYCVDSKSYFKVSDLVYRQFIASKQGKAGRR